VGVYYNRIYSNRAVADYSTANKGQIYLMHATGGCATCETMENIYVYNNTIYNNDDANSPTGERGGIIVEVGDDGDLLINNVLIKNNILDQNFTSDSDKGFELQVLDAGAGDITGLVLDYNDYYRSANTDYFIHYEGTDYAIAAFATYQSAKSQDTNSITSNPLVAADGSIPNSSPAKDSGIPVFTYAKWLRLG